MRKTASKAVSAQLASGAIRDCDTEASRGSGGNNRHTRPRGCVLTVLAHSPTSREPYECLVAD
jgi:hypothetical protein